MLFKLELCQAILEGRKTETRRVVKEGETLRFTLWWDYAANRMVPLAVVYSAAGHYKWEVGWSYTVQPGRGKEQIGRIRITAIRKERLQDITEEGARAEGFDSREAFLNYWGQINDRQGTRIVDNPEVWVLTFERA